MRKRKEKLRLERSVPRFRAIPIRLNRRRLREDNDRARFYGQCVSKTGITRPFRFYLKIA